MSKLIRTILILVSLSLIAFGQGGTGSIAGRVTDPAGAAIVGAKVIVTNLATNVAKESTSNEEGLYQSLSLTPGSYKITVEAQGFKKLERNEIPVQVADKLSIELKLEVGQVGETTTVTAEIPLLRTADAQTGEVVTYQNVQNLPQVRFGAARDPLQFLIIAGNVQGGGSRAEGGSDTRINGGRAQGIEYYIDGISATTGVGRNISQALAPNMDAVAEFKVITNGISAEYGRLSGGAVELVTKSGSNALHGQVFNYLQNPVLNANTWFNNRTNGRKQEYRQNNFGAAVGGPLVLPRFGEGGPAIWKGTNRTFWFFNYDGLRNSEAGNSVLLSVPTAEERQGIFVNTRYNGVATDIFRMDSPVIPDPTPGSSEIVRTQRWVTGPDDPRPACRNQQGKCLPLNQISATSRAILALLPLPNRAPENNSSFVNNFVGSRSNVTQSNQWALRLDHRFSDSQSIYGRFSRLNSNSERTPISGYAFSRAQRQAVNGGFGMTMGYNWQISPTLIFDAKLGGSHNPFNNGGFLDSGFSSAGIPFDPITRSYLGTKGFPGISVVGLGTISDTWGENQSRNRNLSTYNANASMIKIMGKHTAKFGYEQRRYYDSFGRSSSSDFYFISSSVNRVVGDRSWQNYDQANGIATFLYGYNHYALAAAPVDRTTNTNYHGAYVQDDWRMTQKLTVGLGVRWDGETPTTERYNKLYFWDNNAPSQWTVKPGYDLKAEMRRSGFTEAQIARVRVPSFLTSGVPNGAIRKAGTPEFPARSGQSFYPWQFAPRLSMAYAMNDKTVIRASFAKMYISTTGDENGPTSASGGIALGDQAFNGWHHTPDGFRTILSNWDNPYVRTGAVTKRADSNQLANFQASFGEPAAAFDRNIRMPHEWTWSLGIQRQVGNKLALEATYSANLGRRLLGQDVISRFPRDLLSEANRDLYFPDTTGAARRVPSPFVQPIQQFGEGTIDVGWLQYDRPFFGPVYINGAGVGSSDYHSVNFRANYRFFKESNVLVNYTIGQMKDNVGGPFGQFGKTRQTYDSVDSIYGLSPVDEKHRLVVVYNVELPFGKGRMFAGSPNGVGGKALDYIIGGWSVAGITAYRSGRPVTFPGVQDLNSLRIVNTFFNTKTPGDQNLVTSGFSDPRSVLDPTGTLGAEGPRALDLAGKFLVNAVRNPSGKITGYSPITGFFPGNLFPVFGGLRNPGYFSNDISLGKKFDLNSDGNRYFQLRFEGSNIFNHTGLGGYQTNLRNDSTFGRIVGTTHVPRRIQVSGRIVF